MPVSTISDYSASINTPQMVKASMLIGGSPVKKNGRQIKYSGGFCVVFPYETATKKYAVRCWHVNIDNIQRRTKLISDAIHAANLPYFVSFDYVPNGLMTTLGCQPIVVMEWVDAKTLKGYISAHINDSSALKKLAESFKNMVADLHKHRLAHGDLQHGNIMVRDDGSLVLVDYDSMYAPELDGFTDDIKGLAGYQHPARWKNRSLNEKIDYFSEIVIYTSILALAKHPNLWNELNLEDTETMLFSFEDITSKGASSIFSKLENDSELKVLSDRIKEFLRKDSIDELSPLEHSVVDPITDTISHLTGKWADSGYHRKQPEYRETAEDISKLW